MCYVFILRRRFSINRHGQFVPQSWTWCFPLKIYRSNGTSVNPFFSHNLFHFSQTSSISLICDISGPKDPSSSNFNMRHFDQVPLKQRITGCIEAKSTLDHKELTGIEEIAVMTFPFQTQSSCKTLKKVIPLRPESYTAQYFSILSQSSDSRTEAEWGTTWDCNCVSDTDIGQCVFPSSQISLIIWSAIDFGIHQM